MKEFFKNIKNDKTVFGGFIFSILCIAISFFYTFFLYSYLPPFLPLFNQMPWGDPRIGAKIFIFSPILIAFSIFVLNLFTAAYMYKKIPLISRMLTAATFVVSFFVLLFIIRTIQLVL